MSGRFLFHVDPRDSKGANDELAVQVSFRRAMREKAPRIELVAVPNAGKRSVWERGQRKKEGLVAGFPDMLAMYDGRTCALEFKAGTGALSDKQIDCLNRLMNNNFPVGVFRSSETAVKWLRGHMREAFL